MTTQNEANGKPKRIPWFMQQRSQGQKEADNARVAAARRAAAQPSGPVVLAPITALRDAYNYQLQLVTPAIPPCPYDHCCAARDRNAEGASSDSPVLSFLVSTLRREVEELQGHMSKAAEHREQQAEKQAAQLRQRDESQAAALQCVKQQLLAEIEARAQQQQAEAAAATELREAADVASSKRLAELGSQLHAATDSIDQLSQQLKQAREDAHQEYAQVQAGADEQRSSNAEQMAAATQAREKVSEAMQHLSDRVQQLSQKMAATGLAAHERETALQQQLTSQNAQLDAVCIRIDDLQVSLAKVEADKFAMEGQLARLSERIEQLQQLQQQPPVVSLGEARDAHDIMPVTESSSTTAQPSVQLQRHKVPATVAAPLPQPLADGGQSMTARDQQEKVGQAVEEDERGAGASRAPDFVSAPSPQQAGASYQRLLLSQPVRNMSILAAAAELDEHSRPHPCSPSEAGLSFQPPADPPADDLVAAARQSDDEAESPAPLLSQPLSEQLRASKPTVATQAAPTKLRKRRHSRARAVDDEWDPAEDKDGGSKKKKKSKTGPKRQSRQETQSTGSPQDEPIDLTFSSPPTLAHHTRLQSVMKESLQMHRAATATGASRLETDPSPQQAPQPSAATSSAPHLTVAASQPQSAAAAATAAAVVNAPSAARLTRAQSQVADDGSDPYDLDKFIARFPPKVLQPLASTSRTSPASKSGRAASRASNKASRPLPVRSSISASVKPKARLPASTALQTSAPPPGQQSQQRPSQPMQSTQSFMSARIPAKRCLFGGSSDDDVDTEAHFFATQIQPSIAQEEEETSSVPSPLPHGRPLPAARKRASSARPQSAERRPIRAKRQRVMAPSPSTSVQLALFAEPPDDPFEPDEQ